MSLRTTLPALGLILAATAAAGCGSGTQTGDDIRREHVTHVSVTRSGGLDGGQTVVEAARDGEVAISRRATGRDRLERSHDGLSADQRAELERELSAVDWDRVAAPDARSLCCDRIIVTVRYGGHEAAWPAGEAAPDAHLQRAAAILAAPAG